MEGITARRTALRGEQHWDRTVRGAILKPAKPAPGLQITQACIPRNPVGNTVLRNIERPVVGRVLINRDGIGQIRQETNIFEKERAVIRLETKGSGVVGSVFERHRETPVGERLPLLIPNRSAKLQRHVRGIASVLRELVPPFRAHRQAEGRIAGQILGGGALLQSDDRPLLRKNAVDHRT
ncbi:MAG: hypothetical protein OXC66_11305 [Roseovarius sp.]|nr:hypothetical protein [Roseovarius sp.]